MGTDSAIVPFSRRAMLIINPVSGKKLVLRHTAQIVRILMDAGYLVTVMVTSRRGEATEFARAYGRENDLICCAGGDGTLNETVSGLAAEGLRTPLGYIPCGSTNDFAISRGLSRDVPTAARNAAFGHIVHYDIGCFGKQFFSYVAAFGAFSWLSYTTDQNLKNVLGHTAYILDGIRDLSRIKALHLKFSLDGVLYEDDYLFGAICNSTSIAGTLTLPASLVDTCDGKFEVLLVRAPKTILDLELAVRGLLTQDYSCPLITMRQAQDIYVHSPEGVEWSLDGESSGSFEQVHITPVPGFLQLRQ